LTRTSQAPDASCSEPRNRPSNAVVTEAGLVVKRWRRYGKDRLYVSLPNEVKVGWWDLATDEPHPETPDDLPVLTTAAESWKTTQTPRPVVAPQAEIELATLPTEAADSAGAAAPAADAVVLAAAESAAAQERPWIDLATNHAGEAAREQAVAAREAAPVRTLLARALGVHTDERAWRIGAVGEEKVAVQLDKIVGKDPRWRVIHAIPVGHRGSDIDHLIIGPGGVFTANAKHHPGAQIWVGGNTFLVNGNKQPYVRNSRHEAARAADLLTNGCGFPVHVEAVIVPVNADDVVVKSQPDGVSVVPRRQVARWLLRHGDILNETTIDAIHNVARRSTTWRP
jgi:hypothetical protein